MKLQRVIFGYKSGKKKTVIREGLEPIKKIHCVAKVYTVLPVSNVKCLYSGGRKATPTSISIFDFYDIKTL